MTVHIRPLSLLTCQSIAVHISHNWSESRKINEVNRVSIISRLACISYAQNMRNSERASGVSGALDLHDYAHAPTKEVIDTM